MERRVVYERNLTGSYMIMEAGEESFDEILIRRKKLPGILEMKRCSVNDMGEFWYTITGKQSLDTLYSIRKAGIEQLRDVILQVCVQLENLERNLISTDCLVLDTELIFMDNQTRTIFFMLDPGEKKPVAERFREMMEELLAKMDHSDPEAVKAFYELYQISMEEGYSIADIRRAMEKKESGRMLEEAAEKVPEKVIAEAEDSKIPEKDSEHLTGKFDWKEPENPEGDFLLTEKEKRKQQKEALRRQKAEAKEYKRAEKNRRKSEEFSETPEQKTGILKRWFRSIREKKLEEQKMEEAEFFGLGDDREQAFSCISASGKKETDDPSDREETILVDHSTIRPEGILLYEGKEDYENIHIRNGKSVLGKGKEADFRLERNTVSRYHAQITRDEEGNFYLEDLNSTNGTFINEKIVNFREKNLLRMNDIVRFADLKYRFI